MVLAATGHASSQARAAVDVATHDLTLNDDAGRAVPVRIFAPAAGGRNCTLVIFSHGANASHGRYDVLLKDWAARGYVVAAPQHVDSEEHPRRHSYKTADTRSLRVRDYALVDATFMPEARPLISNLSLSGAVVAAGHSYGALIAQIAGGARIIRPDGSDFDRRWRRPQAVIALSPPPAIAGFTTPEGWSHISVPQLVVTGTADMMPGFVEDWRQHLDSYVAARPGLACALVFEGVDHNFNGAYCRITPEGAKATPHIAHLNASVDYFIRNSAGGARPDGTQWRKTEWLTPGGATSLTVHAN